MPFVLQVVIATSLTYKIIYLDDLDAVEGGLSLYDFQEVIF